MVNKLKRFIRRNKTLYNIYYITGSCLLYVLKYLVPVDPQLVLFVSFSGRKYDDSPKAIYEQMLLDERFSKMKFVWAFEDTMKFEHVKSRKICINSFKYLITALRARCWIADVGIERGLSFKGRGVFYLNTWHGTPIKRIGQDITSGDGAFKTNIKKWDVDILLAQSEYEKAIYRRVFGVIPEKIRIIGLPRNDALTKYSQIELESIKKRLNIDSGRKIILYAPTFRESTVDIPADCISALPVNFKKWEDKLSKDYILLFRAHSAVTQILNIKSTSFVHDVSSYDCLNDLLLISDILISDYSSIFFDYSIMNKPMLCFAYDYDKYVQERGLYFDIRKELSDEILSDEDQLLEAILHLDYVKSVQKAIRFRTKYVAEFGDATVKSLDIIARNINL